MGLVTQSLAVPAVKPAEGSVSPAPSESRSMAPAWQAASAALLEREKAHTRVGDELARERRSLPWVPVEKEYALHTADGPRTLAQLFDGRSQLLIYHFMFGPSYEAGCPVNSSMADTFDSLIPHLKARDVTLIAVSGAPIERLEANSSQEKRVMSATSKRAANWQSAPISMKVMA